MKMSDFAKFFCRVFGEMISKTFNNQPRMRRFRSIKKNMRIKSVFSHSFEKYGKVLTGYDVTDLLKKLDETTKKPDNAVIYEPGDAGLEALPIAKEFSDNAYGGMPIQVGYCNGNNTKLNCLEWHRGSELNIPSNDMELLFRFTKQLSTMHHVQL